MYNKYIMCYEGLKAVYTAKREHQGLPLYTVYRPRPGYLLYEFTRMVTL